MTSTKFVLAGAEQQAKIAEQAQTFHKAFREEVSALQASVEKPSVTSLNRVVDRCDKGIFLQVKKGVDEQFKRK